MKVINLARVSTQEQKEAGNSLPAQVFRLQEYIERHPTLVKDEEFTFDETAYKEGRNKLDNVLDYIDSSKEVLPSLTS
jgi:DNA invertase Pin-like site-specific DNA recombinase